MAAPSGAHASGGEPDLTFACADARPSCFDFPNCCQNRSGSARCPNAGGGAITHDPPHAGQTEAAPASADRLQPIVFTADGLPHRQRLDAWNARFQTLNTILVPDPVASTPYYRNENWLLGNMMFSISRISACRFERHRDHLRRDALDHWVVRVLRHGTNKVQLGEDRHVFAPGQPFLFSLAEPWISDWTASEWVSINLPRDAFPAISAGLAALGPGPLHGPGVPMLADYLLLLERHLREATPADVAALGEVTRAMLSACLLRTAAPRAVTAEAVAVAQFERVRALIRQHLASPTLNTERLSRMTGMSRSALYRLMEPHGGVATYIQSLRLKVVHTLLSDPALAAVPIATLAERVGFFDPSSFSRSFRSAFGCTPREARAAVMAGMQLPNGPPSRWDDGSAEDFGSLLRRIGSDAPLAAGAELARARPLLA
ncbi:helix-turn-helix domain-containing protein [Falsiroseomonas sp.]|uniref:helix-turn-helix domain-containing protein n=1 Tax=Falsiroseomonas sp. TaxID=2870721 RepID=UPI0035657932